MKKLFENEKQLLMTENILDAIKYFGFDKDPNLWNDNVDFYLRNKSKPEFYTDSVVKYGYCRGEEPYNFVYDILERYQHYKNVIEN